MHNNTHDLTRENFSVPRNTPDANTRPGMRDLVIWMKDTER